MNSSAWGTGEMEGAEQTTVWCRTRTAAVWCGECVRGVGVGACVRVGERVVGNTHTCTKKNKIQKQKNATPVSEVVGGRATT